MRSGAVSGALDPDSDRAEAHAIRFYESVRHMTTDVEKIARATGFSVEEIAKVKRFIFIDVHDLGDGDIERFYPNYMMAQSWQRMMDGNPLPHDITMIRHELMECELMEGGMSQAEAHTITTEVYDYEKEAKAFYGKTD